MKTEMITSPKYNIGGHQRENTCVSSINNLNSALNKQRELSSDHSKLVNERFKVRYAAPLCARHQQIFLGYDEGGLASRFQLSREQLLCGSD